MKNRKSPGIDGLPADFYKFFWKNIKHMVTNSIASAYEKGSLSNNQKTGILTLIPKKDKDRLLLKNWRPLTLLTTDYKILTKLLALHMTKVIPSIINHDQTAYIKGRYIGENIRTITDIIEYCKQKNMSAILLLIDFEKAFDTVRWNFLGEILQKFYFGKIFQKWVKILHTDIKSYVINNGHFSDSFNIFRGIRQGCPLSAYLFLLVVEMLAINIRNNTNINGMKLKHKEIKISQMADDTTLILESPLDIAPTKQTLFEFEQIAGLKTNMDKTQAFMIGKHMRFKEDYGLKWNVGPIKMLGIHICTTESNHIKYNFEPQLKTIKSIFNMWKQRNLSLKGKITIINSLAASLLVYPCSTLYTPLHVIQEIDKIFFNFLWNGASNKVAKHIIIKTIDQGGLKMIDISCKIKALNVSWIKRAITNPNCSWKLIMDDILDDITFDYALRCSALAETYLNKLPRFYRQIFSNMHALSDHMANTPAGVLNETLWFNKHVTVEQKPIFWKKWSLQGIKFIGDLLDSRGDFLSLQDLNNKYMVNCTFMDHMRIRQAIPGAWRQIITSNKLLHLRQHIAKPIFIRDAKGTCDVLATNTKKIYWLFLNKYFPNKSPTCIGRWESLYEIDPNIWPSLFLAPFTSCRETYLQSFQFRIIHRILPCNEWLFIRKVVTSNICSYEFCKEKNIDTIRHYLITCPPVTIFWENFVRWWNQLDYSKLNPLVEENIILGFPCFTPEDQVLNFCIIVAKYYIYCSKRHQRNIFIIEFLAIVKNKLAVEEKISIQNNNQEHFRATWSLLYNKL
jgi:hypothetical protein